MNAFYFGPQVPALPELHLIRWAVIETNRGEHHFVGYSMRLREGRVSSAIVEFDASTLRGKTRSGRVYTIGGPPGLNPDAEYVLREWLDACQVTQWRDVSETLNIPRSDRRVW